jgi:hypothetical protein
MSNQRALMGSFSFFEDDLGLEGTIMHKAYSGNFLYFFVSVDDTMSRVQIPHHIPQEERQELSLFLNS